MEIKMYYDISSKVSVVKSIAQTAIASATTTASSAIDLAALNAKGLVFVLDVSAYTAGTATLIVTECATSGGTYTTVSDDYLVGTAAGTALAAVGTKKIGYVGKKPFIKVSVVTVGGSVGLTAGVTTVVATEEIPNTAQ
jgi:hypothetical protein